MPLVSIARSDPNIEEGLVTALQLIGGLGAFLTPGDRVLIKPNLNAEEGFTHPGLTASLVRLLREAGACSACMNALLLSWRLLQDPPQREVEVYLGTKAARSGNGQASCIAFGNCCPDGLQAEVRVSGCPPYPFALGECLKQAGWNA